MTACTLRTPDTLRIADDDLRAVLEGHRHLLFDGGMGTMLQAAGLAAGDLPELLCLTNPDEITAVHVAYVEAGSEVVTTNTFGANARKLGDAATVEALTRLGIVDYLVKPFAYERFCRALDNFCRRRAAVSSSGSLDQDALDSLLHDAPPAALPKGIQPPTLSRIAACLQGAGRPLTGEEIAAAAGLSAVTVRRYMAYLVEQRMAKGEMDYSTGGRPRLVYQMIR